MSAISQLQQATDGELAPRFDPRLVSERMGVIDGQSVSVLDRFREPLAELVIWRRQLAGDLAMWLRTIEAAAMPSGRLLVRRDDIRAAGMALTGADAAGAKGAVGLLADDIASLADRFARIMATSVVDIRLEAVTTDSCWRFHADCVPARLLTTYRGLGTEWVDPADAAEALARQRDYAGAIHCFGEHDVGLFKGSRGSASGGIVHRSPAISGSGETRLLLCLNLQSSASPRLWQG